MLKNTCQESLLACKYLENKDHITGIFNPQGLALLPFTSLLPKTELQSLSSQGNRLHGDSTATTNFKCPEI